MREEQKRANPEILEAIFQAFYLSQSNSLAGIVSMLNGLNGSTIATTGTSWDSEAPATKISCSVVKLDPSLFYRRLPLEQLGELAKVVLIEIGYRPITHASGFEVGRVVATMSRKPNRTVGAYR
jgi:hypothetical protein